MLNKRRHGKESEPVGVVHVPRSIRATLFVCCASSVRVAPCYAACIPCNIGAFCLHYDTCVTSVLYICNWSTLQEALLHLRFQIAGYAILLLGFWAWLLWIDYNRVSESDSSAAALNAQSN